MIGTVLGYAAGVPPWVLLLLVFALPAAEASLFLGLAVPGEIMVLLGGAAAHAGKVPLAAVIAAAIAGAVTGDQIGFHLGRRYGERLVGRLPPRLRQSGRVDATLELLRRRGFAGVALGRWAAALRALVPGLAGMSGMRSLTFTAANISGGALWATAVAVAGYLAGASYRVLESRLGYAGDVVLVVFLLAVVGQVVLHRRVSRPRSPE